MMKVLVKDVKKEENKLEGIYGWLILPFFGLLIYSFLSIIFFMIFVSQLIIDKTFYFYQIQFIAIILLGVFSIYLFILMIKNDKRFPKLMISFLIIFAILNFIINFINLRLFSLVVSLAFDILLIIYFKVSKRVKNTFIY